MKRRCDLCKAKKDVEFVVSSKTLAMCFSKSDIDTADVKTSHIIKHICVNCFKKIFQQGAEKCRS